MQNNKRPETMERITTPALAQAFIAEQIRAAHPRHRQEPGVRTREPRPAAQGRAGAGHPGVPP